ncbi:MAG: AmmeMemoRadiSam system radical SAM enzyme [Clostridiales bacterium]|jgi:pyruvate formate lyase activating enzyme|nr:AmmeMemoRadiSam system radical SAM enzyme [Clostridiales bacterium]
MSDAVCPVCFRHCRLKEGQIGFCRARRNEGGKSVSVNYAKVTSVALDPIEKKPLARFHPGSMILSVGSFGCNMDCPFCQNESCSRADEHSVEWRALPPDELAELAEKLRPRGNIGAAFTYNEPMIGFEYVRDAARAVRARGMKNAVVTNGAVSLDALDEVLPYVDAFNIDLKGFTDKWYRELGGDLSTVKAFIAEAAKRAHVELTTLVVPGGNDSEEEMRALSSWVASVGKSIPLHVTRFFPRRNMLDRAPTDVNLLRRLAGIACENLETVLLGNV